MREEPAFKNEAAAGYDRAFAHVTAWLMPFLSPAAHLVPGKRVLDIATGTGLSPSRCPIFCRGFRSKCILGIF